VVSFFRYPGGKAKLRNEIIQRLGGLAPAYHFQYREPFFGGGSIGLKLITDNPGVKKIWVNDRDAGIACLWTSVMNYPEDLKQAVRDFKPSVPLFHEYKGELVQNLPAPTQRQSVVQYGFKKLAIHQTSYSGLGTKSGGPLGGQSQESQYKIDCRWSPDYICKKIDKLHQLFASVEVAYKGCTNLDFEEVVLGEGKNTLIYLDPPYYIKGNDLYQHGFTDHDHQRLADSLQGSDHSWLLSYDDCEQVKKLYQWAKVCKIEEVSYSITARKDKENGNRLSRKKTELLIHP
jgi:DNA adenine methylase